LFSFLIFLFIYFNLILFVLFSLYLLLFLFLCPYPKFVPIQAQAVKFTTRFFPMLIPNPASEVAFPPPQATKLSADS